MDVEDLNYVDVCAFKVHNGKLVKMRSWPKRRAWTIIGLVSAFLLLEILISTNVKAQLVPLSKVIDHPVDDQENKQPSHKSGSSSEESSYQGKPLSQKKKDIHIKIAQSHLQDKQEAESSVPLEGDGGGTDEKFFRKDKSPELQNPARHESDAWLLKFLLEQYRISDTVEEKVEILQNLENFSHKFENGRDLFKSTTAVRDILIPALNSTETEIRKSACLVFAVAAQNNGVVQRIAKDAGAIRNLVHLLSFDPPLRTTALFALSSILRNFPEAQAKFIHEGGIPALIKVAFSFETRKRCLSLVTDLLTERKYCLIELENRKSSKQAADDFHFGTSSATTRDPNTVGDHVDHYDNLEDPCDEFKVLEKALKDSGWCDVVADSVKAIAGFEIEDQLLTVEAVASSLTFCRSEVASQSRILQGLLVKFQDDEDFQEESLTLRSIIDTVTVSKHNLQSKDEL